MNSIRKYKFTYIMERIKCNEDIILKINPELKDKLEDLQEFHKNLENNIYNNIEDEITVGKDVVDILININDNILENKLFNIKHSSNPDVYIDFDTHEFIVNYPNGIMNELCKED